MASEYCLEVIDAHLAEIEHPDPTPTNHTFLADDRLSGLPTYCSRASCRTLRLNQISAFSVLYSDKTLTVNPFQYALRFYSEENPKRFKSELAFAIHSYYQQKPLIDTGIIQYIDYDCMNVCNDCLAKVLFDKGSTNLEDDDLIGIVWDYIRDSTSIFREDASTIRIEFDQTHSEHIIYLRGHKNIISEIKNFADFPLNKMLEIGFFKNLFESITHEMVAKNHYCDEVGIQNILGSPSEFKVASAFAQTAAHGPSIEAGFPLFAPANLTEAIKIREQEWHHLSDFRNSIRECISDGHISDADALDHVRSATSAIYKKISKSRQMSTSDLIAATGNSGMLFLTAAMTSGLSGVVSSIAGALGGSHLGEKGARTVLQHLKIPEEVKEDRFYYGWRVGRALLKK